MDSLGLQLAFVLIGMIVLSTLLLFALVALLRLATRKSCQVLDSDLTVPQKALWLVNIVLAFINPMLGLLLYLVVTRNYQPAEL